MCKHKHDVHSLMQNKGHGLGAMHLQHLIKTNHVQLKSRISRGLLRICSKNGRFWSNLRVQLYEQKQGAQKEN